VLFVIGGYWKNKQLLKVDLIQAKFFFQKLNSWQFVIFKKKIFVIVIVEEKNVLNNLSLLFLL
jgi:hypothetical protein